MNDEQNLNARQIIAGIRIENPFANVPLAGAPPSEGNQRLELCSQTFPQPTRVTSNLAPHFKFVHDCPCNGSKKQFFEN